MDMLNFAQMVNGSGLLVQAEPVTTQPDAADTAQTPAAFSETLLDMLESLMVGQGVKPLRDPTGSALPLSLDDDDSAADTQASGEKVLKEDAQQKLLETLLMTSQTPPPEPMAMAIPMPMPLTGDEALPAAIQPLAAAQPQLLGMAQPQQPQGLRTSAPGPAAAPVAMEPASGTQPGAQPVPPTLMAAMTPVAPVTPQAPEGAPAAVSTPADPSAPASTLKMDAEPSRWSEQLHRALGDRLQVQVKEQIQHATIRLDPPEMGKIDIAMQVDNGRVQVQINASHAEVYRALQQTSNDLRQSLTEQNFVQVNVQISSQSGGQQRGREPRFTWEENAIQAGATFADDTSATRDRREDGSVLLTV